MKRIFYLLVSLVAVSVMVISCNDDETYAEQKEREAKNIKKWISKHDINVIFMSEFLQDTITDTLRNEYVLFPDNGVYMQIVNRGDGRILLPDEMWTMNARFVEVYVSSEDTMTMNLYQQVPDEFYIKRTGDNYTASFTSGIMASVYGTSVPSAWIMAFPFIKPGVLNGKSAAKVRLIVPHTSGTQAASASVYPTFYEISITRNTSKFLE